MPKDYSDLFQGDKFAFLDPGYKKPATLETPKEHKITPDNEQGMLSAIGTGIGRGLIGVGEMGMNALAGVDEAVDRYIMAEPENDPDNFDLKKWATKQAKDIEGFKNRFTPATEGAKGTIAGGVESAVTSLGTKIPLAVLGALAAPIGGIPVALGATLGYLSGIPMFGAAQYNTAIHKYQKGFMAEGHDAVKARNMAETPALIESAFEMGTETISDLIEIATLKAGKAITAPGKIMAKETLHNLLRNGTYKAALKTGATIWGAETSGEMLNAMGQLATEKVYGESRDLTEVLNDGKFWDGVTDQFGEIAVAGLIFAGLGGGGHIVRNRRDATALENAIAQDEDGKLLGNPVAQKEKRMAAAQRIYQDIAQESQPMADHFYRGAFAAIQDNESISFETELDLLSEQQIAGPGNMARRIAGGMSPTEAAVEDYDAVQEDEARDIDFGMKEDAALKEEHERSTQDAAWMEDVITEVETKPETEKLLKEKKVNLEELLEKTDSPTDQYLLMQEIAAVENEINVVAEKPAEVKKTSSEIEKQKALDVAEDKQKAEDREADFQSEILKAEIGVTKQVERGKAEDPTIDQVAIAKKKAATRKGVETRADKLAQKKAEEILAAEDKKLKPVDIKTAVAKESAEVFEGEAAREEEIVRQAATREEAAKKGSKAAVDLAKELETGTGPISEDDALPQRDDEDVIKETAATAESIKAEAEELTIKEREVEKDREAEDQMTAEQIQTYEDTQAQGTNQTDTADYILLKGDKIPYVRDSGYSVGEISSAMTAVSKGKTLTEKQKVVAEEMFAAQHKTYQDAYGEDKVGETPLSLEKYYDAKGRADATPQEKVTTKVKQERQILDQKGRSKEGLKAYRGAVDKVAAEAAKELQKKQPTSDKLTKTGLAQKTVENERARAISLTAEQPGKLHGKPTAKMSGTISISQLDKTLSADTGRISQLAGQIKRRGYNPKKPIQVIVDVYGKTHVVRGRKQVEAMRKLGKRKIPAEITYLAGSEQVTGAMHPDGVKFSKTEEGTPQVTPQVEEDAPEVGETVLAITNTVNKLFKRPQASDIVEVVKDDEALAVALYRAGGNPEGIVYFGNQGAYHNGKVYLVASNLSLDTVKGVLAHEGLHYVMGREQGFTKEFSQLKDMVSTALSSKVKTAEHTALLAARKRAIKAKVEGKYLLEETIAYYLEETANDTLSFKQKIILAAKKSLVRLGFTYKSLGLTGQDLANMVSAQLRAESARKQKSTYSFAQSPKMSLMAAAERVKAEPAFKAWFKKSQATDYDNDPKVLFHGTTHDFDTFDLTKGGSEGHYGGDVIYLTDSPDDASFNYAGRGPDLVSRIVMVAERLEDEIQQNINGEDASALVDMGFTEEEAQSVIAESTDRYTAAQILSGRILDGGSYNVMPVYASIQNPARIGVDNPTYIDLNPKIPEEDLADFEEEAWETVQEDYSLDEEEKEDYADEIREKQIELYRESGYEEDYSKLEEFQNAVIYAIDSFGGNGADVFVDIQEDIGFYEEFELTKFDEVLRQHDQMYELYDDGDLISPGAVLTEIYKRLGYDGVVMNAESAFGGGGGLGGTGHVSNTEHTILFDTTQVKSVFNKGTYGVEESRVSYSKLSNWGTALPGMITNSKKWPVKASGEKLLKHIEKNIKSGAIPKAQAEEMQWDGMLEWVSEQDSVTAQQAAQYAQDHQINVTAESAIGQEDFSGYTVEYDENEGGFYLVDQDGQPTDIWFGMEDEALDAISPVYKYEGYVLPGGKNYKELLIKMPDGQYQGAHYNKKGVLAHLRINEREDFDGNQTLFIEEIQSDWHQEGKEKGYETVPEFSENLEAKPDSAGNIYIYAKDTGEKIGGQSQFGYETEGQAIEDWKKWPSTLGKAGVQDAPFKDTWHMLAMKRAIRYAVDNNLQQVAWTTGAQQADRYSLRKQLDTLTWGPKDNVLRGYEKSIIKISELVQKEDLPSVIGGEATKRLLAQSLNEAHGYPQYIIKGEALEVGGEGMKSFYDQKITNSTKKFIKQFGGKIESADLDTTEDQGPPTSQPSFKITEQMVDSVRGGMPLFSKVKQAGSLYSVKEKDVRLEFVNQMAMLGDTVFKIDPGNGTGVGSRGRTGWHNNLPASAYAGEIGRYYGDVKVNEKTIVAKQPNPEGQRIASPNIEAPKFSRKKKGPQDKNLITIHNLSADNIRHAEGLGGVAAPSLAVVRSDKNDFKGFGEISLVIAPDILNERQTKTYDADIYTPRHPRAENIINKKAYKEFEALIDTAPSVLAGYPSRSDLEEGNISRALDYDPTFRFVYLDSEGLLSKKVKGSSDTFFIREQINKKLRSKKVREGFETYARKWESKLISGRRMFDGYTPLGDRRYKPYTLENIVKKMTKQLRGGENFMYGAGMVRSKFTKKLPSISAIQKHRDKIVSGADFEQLKEAAEEALWETLEVLKPYYKFDTESFGYGDDASAAIMEGHKGLNEAFDMNSEAWAKVNDLVDMLKNMPSQYFEAKVQRAMSFSEFSGAAIPRGTSPDIIGILKNAGVSIRYYKKSDVADRSRAVAGFRDVLFSKLDTPEIQISGTDAILARNKFDRRIVLNHQMIGDATITDGGDGYGVFTDSYINPVHLEVNPKAIKQMSRDWEKGLKIDRTKPLPPNWMDLARLPGAWADGGHIYLEKRGEVPLGQQRLFDPRYNNIDSRLQVRASLETIPMRESVKYSKKNDTKYLTAIARGDMKTAQKLVNIAAEETGYIIGPVFHGSPNKDFTQFNIPSQGFNSNVFGSYIVSRNAAFFTADKKSAEGYQTQGDRKSGSTRSFNLSGDFVDIRSGISDALWNTLTARGVNGKWLDLLGASWELFDKEQDSGARLVKTLQDMGYHGALISDTDGERDFDSYAVFDPTQIKLTDPATYDSAGDVVSLSERFDYQSDDIRYSKLPSIDPEIEASRSFAVKIFERRDEKQLEVNNITKEMETRIQRLAGATRTKSLLSDAPTKDTASSRELSMAMMLYRDLGDNQTAAPEFLSWAKKQISGKMTAVARMRLQEKMKIVNRALKLTKDQKEFVDTYIEKQFAEVGRRAVSTGAINSAIDNYVRRIWTFPESDRGPEGGPGTPYSFKVFTTASKQRKLDTILDGWMRGYELKTAGIHGSFDSIATEISNIEANQAFIVEGRTTKDLSGVPLLTTKKEEGYQELEASGFKVWVMVGEVKPGEDYGDLDAFLGDGRFEIEVNSFGQKVFLTPPNDDMASQLFEKQSLRAPKDLAVIINKMTKGESLFSETPTLQAINKMNASLKGWILLSSFFHHMAGARSWFFGVNHGYKNGAWNPIAAHKAGLKKIEGQGDLIRLGIRGGLTFGKMQDFDETYAREPGFISHVLTKLDMAKTLKTYETVERAREGFAGSLFKRFFAGLKAEAFCVEFTHELAKDPTQDQDKLAERVATLINADFGGLHLQRMGRNPTLQKMGRLLLLAPDWTESNFRTFFGMTTGNKLNRWVNKMIGDVPPPPGMEKHYRTFWGRVAVRSMTATIIMQMLSGVDDPEDKWKFYEEQFGSFDQFRKLRWTQWEVTNLYRALGMEIEDDKRKTFSIVGHFADPLKLVSPDRLIKGKGSPAIKLAEAGFSGSDWAERPFTSVEELLETGKTIKKSRFQKKEELITRLPSYIVNQTISMQPIQVGYLLKWLQGEEDGLSAILSSAGAHVSNAWIPDVIGDKYSEKGAAIRKDKALDQAMRSQGMTDEARDLREKKYGSSKTFFTMVRKLSRAQAKIRRKNKALKRAEVAGNTALIRILKADIDKIKEEFNRV